MRPGRSITRGGLFPGGALGHEPSFGSQAGQKLSIPKTNSVAKAWDGIQGSQILRDEGGVSRCVCGWG